MDYLKTQGRIFNIQRYSIHDGSGIRTIVFFKGCFLRCRWCCNPESQRYEIETMQMNGKTETVGKDVTVAEMLDEVEKDRAYYRRSGGGLTLSGGEALTQPEFARDLLRAAKAKGIHTSIESTAIADFRYIEMILPYLDEFLMDIKHMDSVKHERFTSKHNEIALENARKIAADSQNETQLIIRIPVIPTFNDTAEEIAEIARFAAALPNVQEIHLLPYHRFGEGKYTGLHREYTMGDVAALSDMDMKILLDTAAKVSGLRCQIGG